MISAGSPLLRARGPTQAQPEDCFPGCGLVRALAQFDLARPSPPFHAGRVRTANLVLSPAHFQPDVRACEVGQVGHGSPNQQDVDGQSVPICTTTPDVIPTTTDQAQHLGTPANDQAIAEACAGCYPPKALRHSLQKGLYRLQPPAVTSARGDRCYIGRPDRFYPRGVVTNTTPLAVTAPKAPGPAPGACIVTAPKAPGPAPKAPGPARGASVVTAPKAPGPAPVAERDQREPSHKKS
ncbi:hypothetical protein PCANC_00844 [Puccinia coronata f. sp. avenae]|uniref:Uncharacterized protein n=1 Tax=Puccinia coronata f. sp. avenae TaxID=200324 RepID=A0A2N5W7X1_9BASI|nr:hypothetical protein PCANC_00844 [Puccinia coronata f. sp. avenae]